MPKHKVPPVVAESDLCVDGWVPVDQNTLETAFESVYAVGDVTSIGTPKAGIFAERQGAVVADRIIEQHRSKSADSTFDGVGFCYLELGQDKVARVQVTFRNGQPPTGVFDGASAMNAADRTEFGTSRVRKWFGREWKPVG